MPHPLRGVGTPLGGIMSFNEFGASKFAPRVPPGSARYEGPSTEAVGTGTGVGLVGGAAAGAGTGAAIGTIGGPLAPITVPIGATIGGIIGGIGGATSGYKRAKRGEKPDVAGAASNIVNAASTLKKNKFGPRARSLAAAAYGAYGGGGDLIGG